MGDDFSDPFSDAGGATLLHPSHGDDRHSEEVAKKSARVLRHLKPAPTGIQSAIVKDHGVGLQACFNKSCQLVLDRHGKVASEKRQEREMSKNENRLQPWCPLSSYDEHGFPTHYSSFEECCEDYHTGLRGSTSLALPPVCEKLWKIDYNYYTDNPSLAQWDAYGGQNGWTA